MKNWTYYFRTKNPDFEIVIMTPVCIKPYKKYRYKICQDIRVIINRKVFTIPKDFVTDLASIPRIIWPVLSPAHSSLFVGAIIHDWFYRMTGDFTRKEADLIFYEIIKQSGLGSIRSKGAYYAVRLFGKAFFNDIQT